VHSIAYPYAPTQAALFRRVLARAGIDAHGARSWRRCRRTYKAAIFALECALVKL
jgi:hypothetical protein